MLVCPPLHTFYHSKPRPTATRGDCATLALNQMTICRDVHVEIQHQQPIPQVATAFAPLVRASNTMRKMLNDERRPVLNFGVG